MKPTREHLKSKKRGGEWLALEGKGATANSTAEMIAKVKSLKRWQQARSGHFEGQGQQSRTK